MPNATIAVAHLIELGCPPREHWEFQGHASHPPPEPCHDAQVLRARLDTLKLAIALQESPVRDRSYSTERDKLSLKLKIARVPDAKRETILDLADQVARLRTLVLAGTIA